MIKIVPILTDIENLHNQTGQLVREQGVNKKLFPERHGYWVRLLQANVRLRNERNGKLIGKEENDILGGDLHPVDLVYDTSVGALRIEPAIAPVCKNCGTIYLKEGSVANAVGVPCGGCGTQLHIKEGETTYDWTKKSNLVEEDVRRRIQRDLAEAIDNNKRIRWSTKFGENGQLERTLISLKMNAESDQRNKVFVSKNLLELNEWLNKVADAGEFRRIPAGTGVEAIMNPFKPEFLKNVHMSALKKAPGKESGEVTQMPVLSDADNNAKVKERD